MEMAVGIFVSDFAELLAGLYRRAQEPGWAALNLGLRQI